MLHAFQSIRRLQIKALRKVDTLFAGIYHSTFKGRGLEFQDVREYQPGDDIRMIDWNVTARSSRPFVKNFREERELTVMLAIDISASSRFSHTERSKQEMMAELGALLAFSAIRNQDHVGLLLFTEEIELYLKPKKGIRHVLRVIRELLYFTPRQRGTHLSKALGFLGRVQRKKTVCFLMSDFLTEEFDRQAALIAKRHELIVFHLYDTFEHCFSPQGLFQMRDLETGQLACIDTAESAVQEHFCRETEKQRTTIKHLFERIGADYVAIDTGETPSNALHRFFATRGRQKRI